MRTVNFQLPWHPRTGSLPRMYLHDFQAELSIPRVPQAEGLNWLARVYARQGPEGADKIEKLLRRFGCDERKIAFRRTWLPEFAGRPPLFPQGADPSMTERMACFRERVQPSVNALYENAPAPSHLLHVTCTGYASPSVAQDLALAKGWPTIVQHIYHLGCYASIPAVRTAAGLLATGAPDVSILHTEFCTLHLEPAAATPEQWVVQSLFADGAVRYAAAAQPPPGPSLRLRATHEMLVPDSRDAMTWDLKREHFAMTLSRDVPKKIAGALPVFLRRLLEKSGLGGRDRGAFDFAVHPGGPLIIDSVRDLLELSEDQVARSRRVLFENGNMSSATLPFVWREILSDGGPPRPVISLAFGPGLTIAGAVMEPA